MTGVATPAVKRGRGRPKIEAPTAPLLTFQGTKMEQLKQLFSQWYACKRCGLSQFRQNEEICFASGNPDAAVMFVGEAPGEEEEQSSVPFVGASGKFLNKMLAQTTDNDSIYELHKWISSGRMTRDKEEKFQEQILEWRNDEFFLTNVVACRPPENRQPTGNEAKACWERLWNIIYIVDPMVIVAVGKVALSTLLRKQVEITKIRGQLFDVEYEGRVGKLRYPVIPILHPSYLLRKADWKEKTGDYQKTIQDLLKALRIADTLKNKNFGTPIPNRVRLE